MITRYTSWVAAFLTMVVALAQEGPAERNPFAAFSINGALADRTGEEIFLLDEAGSIVSRTVTGAGGRFQLTTNEPGRYRLALRRNGQLRAVREVAVNSADPAVTIEPFGEEQALTRQRQPVEVVSAARLRRKIPRSARKLYARGMGRSRGGDVAGAVGQLEEAVKLAPDYLEAVNDLAALHLRRGDHARAESLLKRAMELEPSAWQVHLNLGILLLDRRAYREARQELEKARSWGPGSPLPAFHLGRLHFMEGRLQEAEDHFAQAMETGPGLLKAQLFRGYARLKSGKLQEGKTDLLVYLKRSPDAEDAPRIRQYLKQIDPLVSTLGTGARAPALGPCAPASQEVKHRIMN